MAGNGLPSKNDEHAYERLFLLRNLPACFKGVSFNRLNHVDTLPLDP
jgi:hypothetical protein